jgi:hypothetical protein
MMRELIFFELRLGPDSDRFSTLFKQVKEAMTDVGVVVGRSWGNATGVGRIVVLEREFDSMAAYEADDERFHDARAFMALWREMETCLVSMRVEIWQEF